MGEWINIEDELPKELQTVIAYMDYGDIEILKYKNGVFVNCCGNVTHWIQLPELPEC